MKILITSFEPFAGRRTNLSQQAMERLKKRRSNKEWHNLGVTFALLPVAFTAVQKKLNKLITPAYDLIIMAGEHRKARKVLVERVALNVAHATIKDNKGERAHLASVVGNEPLALMTSIDTEALVSRMRRDGIPARTNHHAGTFVCNASFYGALLKQNKTVFLHLPGRLPQDKKGRCHLERLADCLELVCLTSMNGH